MVTTRIDRNLDGMYLTVSNGATKKLPITYLNESLSKAVRERLLSLKAAYADRVANTENALFDYLTKESDLSYMTGTDLKAISDPYLTANVDFSKIDTSPPFTTLDLNEMHPGAVDRDYFKIKVAGQSFLWDYITNLVPTTVGMDFVYEKIVVGFDIEDIMQGNTISQGINLQNYNIGQEGTSPTGYLYRDNPAYNPIKSVYTE